MDETATSKIVDRAKDLVKSAANGSVPDLENTLMDIRCKGSLRGRHSAPNAETPPRRCRLKCAKHAGKVRASC